jgi:hypothetical protein
MLATVNEHLDGFFSIPSRKLGSSLKHATTMALDSRPNYYPVPRYTT